MLSITGVINYHFAHFSSMDSDCIICMYVYLEVIYNNPTTDLYISPSRYIEIIGVQVHVQRRLCININ